METRNIKISLETAKRWFNGTDKELQELAGQTYPELAKKELPKTWKELGNVKGYYINTFGEVKKFTDMQSDMDDCDKNVFATKEQAEASIALAQLSQLREVYRDGWVADYKEPLQMKYTITFYEDKLSKSSQHNTMHNFLSFQDQETRDLFLENFRDLIEQAKPLMS
jgi:hypothetical protein